MKRNSIFAIGFGMLLGVSLLTPGCGDSGSTAKKDGSLDVKKDTGSADGGGTGGVKGTGGALGSGGAVGSGGARGSGGAVGTGGALGTGGSTGVDAGLDGPAVKLDVAVERTGNDAVDVPITNPETGSEVGSVKLDVGSIDNGLDQAGIDAPVTLDLAIDESILDTGAVEAQIDTTGLD